MSKNLKITAAKREGTGKGIARALRRENRIPAVIYGDGKEPVAISLSANDANVMYRKGTMMTHLTDIDVDGAKELVLARDVQLHPVSDFVLHVDYLRVSAKTKIHVNVPVHFLNEEECKGLDKGGILNVVRHDVEVVCAATDIPECIEIDIAEFEIGDAIKISDAVMPKGAKPAIDDRDFTIATIVAPRTAAEEEAEEAENAEDIENADKGEEAEGEGDDAAAEDKAEE